MKIEVIVEKTKTGYSAYAQKYTVYTVGTSLEELKSNIVDALNIHFEAQNKVVSDKDLKINLDLPQFFQYFKVINIEALSERIGIDKQILLQYVNGIKKPSLTQTQRILKGVQQVGNELASVRFIL